jgi:hypothetical protein
VDYFGNGYFGPRYYGAQYWGPAGGVSGNGFNGELRDIRRLPAVSRRLILSRINEDDIAVITSILAGEDDG